MARPGQPRPRRRLLPCALPGSISPTTSLETGTLHRPLRLIAAVRPGAGGDPRPRAWQVGAVTLAAAMILASCSRDLSALTGSSNPSDPTLAPGETLPIPDPVDGQAQSCAQALRPSHRRLRQVGREQEAELSDHVRGQDRAVRRHAADRGSDGCLGCRLRRFVDLRPDQGLRDREDPGRGPWREGQGLHQDGRRRVEGDEGLRRVGQLRAVQGGRHCRRRDLPRAGQDRWHRVPQGLHPQGRPDPPDHAHRRRQGGEGRRNEARARDRRQGPAPAGQLGLRARARVGQSGQLQRVEYELDLRFSKVGDKLTIRRP